ncbi:four-carbon acid sugar kinase family protein, partial [Pseudomonas aeruginosa]|uniref:four-carbon acid sugar kinase family protein n=1 Tax=Pseudomonas aeruginosa TaxID=287 RepID=UPI001F4AB50C
METQTLRHTLEELGEKPFDGEIIYPFFMEGGRYTLNNIHYVQEGEQLIPAGLTEFAKDKSFGYKAPSLPEWCVEKSGGTVCAQDITCISLQNLCTCSY